MKLRETTESFWFKDRYARAILPDGKILGSDSFIDILPQAFAAFIGLNHAETAVETAVEKLVDREKRIIKLLSPPFTPESAEKIGYIAAYPEGIRENGGQYTHAAVWLAMALFALGKEEKGRELVDIINPTGFYADKSLAERYKTEPFVLAGDVYAKEGIASRGGWSHFTGSAAWFYRCIAENYYGYIRSTGNESAERMPSICKVFGTYKPPKIGVKPNQSAKKRTKK